MLNNEREEFNYWEDDGELKEMLPVDFSTTFYRIVEITERSVLYPVRHYLEGKLMTLTSEAVWCPRITHTLTDRGKTKFIAQSNNGSITERYIVSKITCFDPQQAFRLEHNLRAIVSNKTSPYRDISAYIQVRGTIIQKSGIIKNAEVHLWAPWILEDDILIVTEMVDSEAFLNTFMEEHKKSKQVLEAPPAQVAQVEKVEEKKEVNVKEKEKVIPYQVKFRNIDINSLTEEQIRAGFKKKKKKARDDPYQSSLF